MKIQINELFNELDILQNKYGDCNLDAVYGAGKIKNPKICFVFMNPTAKNIATNKKWKGLKAQWIGTKNVWKMFFQLGFLSKDLYESVKNKKPNDWDYDFTLDVYSEVAKNDYYITNLAKATQIDAKKVSDSIYRKYLDLFKKEIDILKPEIIISFGNQVSSVLLNQNIKVGENRKKKFELNIGDNMYNVFPVYYPVGQGQRNLKKSKEDLIWILNNY